MKNIIFAIFAAIIIGFVFSLDTSKNFVGLNFDAQNIKTGNATGVLMIWIYVCMVLGIFFGQAYRVLATIDNTDIGISELRGRIFSVDLWRSLLSSPIVFGAIYLVARDQPDIIVSSILAFENGFICNVIAEKRIKVLTNA
jgi:hypothetical protein